MLRVGLDIGSTTIKTIVLNSQNQVIYSNYQRHYSRITEKTSEIISNIKKAFPAVREVKLAVSGSAGMGLAQSCDVQFIQEVYATRICAEILEPDTDVIIELGGEDAKIIFLDGIPDAHAALDCAGGTGAFIDQMATLLNITTDDLNTLAKQHEKKYTIASRCGVFAKSDIQPLINQGARTSDIAASILSAVVNQTIAGLAQGRKIQGNVLYLGGPLTFLSELRKEFDETLHVKGKCPADSLYYVAMGAAFSAEQSVSLDSFLSGIQNMSTENEFAHISPLFKDREDYNEFIARHSRAKVRRNDINVYTGGIFVGIDAGSTTIKFTVTDTDGSLLLSKYQSNSGNPVPHVKDFLMELYIRYPDLKVLGSAVTGYGEDLIKNAFCMDYGIVETMAHFIAAKEFMPDVDFIIDIGGQDMKCLKIHNGTIDNIYLNEACSSGCGSFLQTFANAMEYDIDEFAKLGRFADKPVDLGSRCTVFMNSSVKQAQKDGASPENISAGLSISIVKNALYKVIRPSSVEELGKNIVVQGGTFYNDCVLRAFEKELGVNAIRPDISGLMGAYGAALYARSRYMSKKVPSSIMDRASLASFTHNVSVANCGLCQNNCRLTVNVFSGNRRFISGNRCERPITHKLSNDRFNIYAQKLNMIKAYTSPKGRRGTLGLPLGLNMYELLPFWHTLFTELGFEVVTSPVSNRDIYLKGQATIPSDTVCFPAKLIHGHIEALIEKGVDTIFYPCMSYNIDEHVGDNHYNCPVVAYYPEVINANVPNLDRVRFIYNHIGIHRQHDFTIKLHEILAEYFPDISLKEVKDAVQCAFKEYHRYMESIRTAGLKILDGALAENKPIIVLAGRPYHIDPEINHGIDRLILGMGAAVLSEDAVFAINNKTIPELQVLNQWTYHNRLYSAAEFVSRQPSNVQFVQLVSFGCGCDAITTDECRRILEENKKIYTQIKIDEIENLGAAKIRLRSLFAAEGIEL